MPSWRRSRPQSAPTVMGTTLMTNVKVAAAVSRILLVLGILAAAVSLGGGSAQAQATRTWVSGVGDDANPCSRTAPCKTFAGAISKTATGGEINCLDPGGFGGVTITKSITIDCHEVFASILNAGISGINIAASGGNVTIRNININGAGTGIRGINITAANNVWIEDVAIFQQTQQGIADTRSTGGTLNITNTVVRNNALPGLGVANTGGTL